MDLDDAAIASLLSGHADTKARLKFSHLHWTSIRNPHSFSLLSRLCAARTLMLLTARFTIGGRSLIRIGSGNNPRD